MHTRAALQVCRYTFAAALAALVAASFAAGVPAPPRVESRPTESSPADASTIEAAANEAATPPATPEQLLVWEFSYKGPGVKAKGQITTKGEVSPDGTYEIVAVSGKRNRRDIVTLEPAGELRTMYGLLFSDNRLWMQSPHFTQGGFSFRDQHARLFNVCYTGPYEGCGAAGQLGYFEEDFRGSKPIPIAFELKQVGTITVPTAATPESGQPFEHVATCVPDPARAPSASLNASAITTADAASGAYSGSASGSADLPCLPDASSNKHL
jgi:hypothetical protein